MIFIYDNKEYKLNDELFDGFYNDEIKPILDIDEKRILEVLQQENLDFEKSYYSMPCEQCKDNKLDDIRAYPFLEYHFYIYTKNDKYITNNIEVEKNNTSFTKMLKEGKVDNSYIVSIIVCYKCGRYTIELEQFDI